MTPINGPFGWIKTIAFTLLAGFFAVFGIQVLRFAYTLNDPFSFIMTFFASNLIILISIAMIVVFAMRMWGSFKTRQNIQTEHTS